MKSSVENKFDLVESKDIDEAVKRLADPKIVDASETGRLLKDYWGNKYKWESSLLADKSRVVRITSMGRNGIDENGSGDDLRIEITIAANGQVRSSFNR